MCLWDVHFYIYFSSQSNRMREALGLVVRLVVPLFNGVAKGLHGIRGINLINILENVRESRHLLANLLAIAANNASMSLSSVQGKAYFALPFLVYKIKRTTSVTALSF